jgi:hypothetical protein
MTVAPARPRLAQYRLATLGGRTWVLSKSHTDLESTHVAHGES